MAYELSCPSCGNMVASPFVRVGAVVACARCSTRYRITEAQVKRRVGALAASQSTGKETESLQIPEPSTDEMIRRTADGSIVGLSGLSEMMRQESGGSSSRGTSSKPAPPIPAAKLAPSRSKASVRRQTDRMVYALIGGLALAIGVVGGLLWYMMSSGPGWTFDVGRGPEAVEDTAPDEVVAPPPGPQQTAPPEPAPQPGGYAALPMLTAERLGPVSWALVDEPYQPQVKDDGVYLVDESRSFEGSQEYYVATLETDAADAIVSATVHLAIVSDEGKCLAKTDVPVALLSAGRPQRLRVALPQGLPEKLPAVEGWAEVGERLAGSVYLGSGRIEPVLDMPETYLVSSPNPSGKRLERAVVVITALDGKNRPIAAWRADVSQPVEPGGVLQFRAKVSLPLLTEPVVRWTVEGVGS